MPTAKVTFEYTWQKTSWSESLWHPYTTDLAEVFPDAEAYGAARTALNGAGVYLQAIRVSDDIIFRDSKYDPKSYWTSALNATPPSTPVAGAVVQVQPLAGVGSYLGNPYDAVQVRMEGGSLYRREMMVRGLPSAIMSPFNGPVLQGQYAAGWNTWTQLLINTWLFRCKNRSDNFALKPVVGIVAPAGMLPGGVITANPVVAAGNYVQLVGFRGLGLVRGKYYVQSVVPPGGVGGAFSVVYLLGLISPTVVNANGYIQLLSTAGGVPQPSYQAITACRIIGQTHRKTGRPFEGSVGRSPAHR